MTYLNFADLDGGFSLISFSLGTIGFLLRDLNKLMDWKLEDEEASTIAGLVIDVAQKLPSIDETIKIDNFNFTILERQRTRITKINIKPLNID